MTNAQDEEIARLCKELAFDKGVRLTPANEWLVSCVNCFRDEVKSSSQYTPSDLFQFVYDQWLLADLNEVASPCLPAARITTDPHIVGRFAVQINYAVDIAVSCYKQYQKLCRPDVEQNLEVDSESKREKETNAARTLKLELTDGITTVIAFEDEPIACLNDPMPGEKLLLKGKMEVRKGILFLSGKNVECLGGEVDTLLVPNATVNILARKLGLPESTQPYGDVVSGGSSELPNGTGESEDLFDNGYDDAELLQHVELLESQMMSREASIQASISRPSHATTLTNATTSSSLTNTQLPVNSSFTSNRQSSPLLYPNSRPSTITTTSPNYVSSSVASSSRALYSAASSSSSLSSTSFPSNSKPLPNRPTVQSKMTSFLSQPPQPAVNGLDFADDFDDVDLDAVNSVLEKIESPQGGPEKPPSSAPPRSQFAQFDDDDDVIFTGTYFDDSFKVPGSSANSAASDSRTETRDEWPPKKYPCERRVDAQVTGLCGKLKINGKGQFKLSGKIKCGEHEFEVDFSPKVLDKVFLLTATEVLAARDKAKKDGSLKRRLDEQLKDSQKKISTLKAKMIIKFECKPDRPIVVDVE